MVYSIHYLGSGSQSPGIWVGELDEAAYLQMEASQNALQEFLRGEGIVFDPDREIDIVALTTETMASMGIKA